MATTPRRKPGDFKAACHTTELRKVHDLDHEIVATARAAGADLIHRRDEVLIPMQCADEFDDRTRFLEHMASEHNKKPRGPAQIKLGRGGWRAPSVSEEGKPFEPKDLEPGTLVTWRESVGTGEFYYDTGARIERRTTLERAGQVWCAAGRPKSAWVVPFTLFEGEQAVMVVQERDGDLYHYETCTRPRQRVA